MLVSSFPICRFVNESWCDKLIVPILLLPWSLPLMRLASSIMDREQG